MKLLKVENEAAYAAIAVIHRLSLRVKREYGSRTRTTASGSTVLSESMVAKMLER